MNTKIESCDVVVIGGGIIGTATAYNLVKQGHSVVLLEKGRIAGEQSSRNWGSVRAQRRPDAELPLMLESIRIWENLEQELGFELDWQQQGQMRLCYDQKWLEWAEQWVPIGRENGLQTQVLTPKETRNLLPHYSANGLLGALYTPTDGCAEPEKVAPAFAEAAKSNGARVFDYCAALEIETTQGAISAVQSERGMIKTDSVVCCGGAWTRRLLRSLKVKHPSLWIRATAAKTQPINIDMRKLVTWGLCAVRQRPDKSLTLAVAEDGIHDIMKDSMRYGLSYLNLAKQNRGLLTFSLGKPFGQDILGEFNCFTKHRTLEPKPDWAGLERAIRAYAVEYPTASVLTIDRAWAGYIDYMPDELPVISECHRVPGLFIAAALCGNGFGMGPVVGKIMSDLISQGSSDHDLSFFRDERFA